ILVKSSITLGALPDVCGLVFWMRAEEVAAVILEVSFAKTTPPPALNPRSVSWANVVASVREEIVNLQVGDIPTVPFREWSSPLEKRAEGTCPKDMAKVPAKLKLLAYFRIVVQEDSDQFVRKTGSTTDEVNGSSLGEAGGIV
ncbi:hypothetical protein HD554DRAFT_2013493, partial [Boletus coccyginus]